MKNNLDYDYLNVVVKKDKIDDIIEKYESFGWVKIETKQHPQYENLIDVEFSRPHKIKHKDALQFLQVNMEVNVINQGRIEKTKHSKSLIMSITLCIISLACFVNSVLAWLYMRPLNKIIVGSLFVVAGLACLILVPILLRKLLKKENLQYEEKSKEYTSTINDIINKAKSYLEGKDE